MEDRKLGRPTVLAYCALAFLLPVTIALAIAVGGLQTKTEESAEKIALLFEHTGDLADLIASPPSRPYLPQDAVRTPGAKIGLDNIHVIADDAGPITDVVDSLNDPSAMTLELLAERGLSAVHPFINHGTSDSWYIVQLPELEPCPVDGSRPASGVCAERPSGGPLSEYLWADCMAGTVILHSSISHKPIRLPIPCGSAKDADGKPLSFNEGGDWLPVRDDRIVIENSPGDHLDVYDTSLSDWNDDVSCLAGAAAYITVDEGDWTQGVDPGLRLTCVDDESVTADPGSLNGITR